VRRGKRNGRMRTFSERARSISRDNRGRLAARGQSR
jgi:hypothetical protein